MRKKNQLKKEICKNCHKIRDKHEDWVATGEYAYKVVCPSTDMDEQGRYRKLMWFEAADNLEFLEWKAHENTKKDL